MPPVVEISLGMSRQAKVCRPAPQSVPFYLHPFSRKVIMSSALLSTESSVNEQAIVSTSDRNRVCQLRDRDSNSDSLNEALGNVQRKIAPLWPLQDFVAVNPFVGLTQQKFLNVSERIESVSSGRMLPELSPFFEKIRSGQIQPEDLDQGLKQCHEEYPAWYSGYSVERMLSICPLEEDEMGESKFQRRYYTVAECVDGHSGVHWNDRITDEVSKYCSSHFDDGQAIWTSPWKGLPCYTAWRKAAVYDRRMEKLGIKNFRQWVSGLPDSPSAAILHLLAIANVPAEHIENWLWCQALSVSGWASHVRYRTLQDGSASEVDNDLVGLIAIRLAYDLAIQQAFEGVKLNRLWPITRSMNYADTVVDREPNDPTLVGYWLQVSAEVAYRRQLFAALSPRSGQADRIDDIETAHTKRFQMVFCIDVRSEVIRRQLEAVSDEVETFGFAGFFGVPMAYRSAVSKRAVSQLPVLLSPAFEVQEGLRPFESGEAETYDTKWKQRRRDTRFYAKLIKTVQSSATSCFSFVEAYGLAYCSHLAMASLGIASAEKRGRHDGVRRADRPRLGPVLNQGVATSDDDTPDLDRRAAIASSILRNLGLTSGFGRLIVLCGHSCQTVNNPYRAGLDCGACGGHSGEPNARVAADLLNDMRVRQCLANDGIPIPVDTRFVAAIHNTTTDEIEFFDVAELPDSHRQDLHDLRRLTGLAGQMTRVERGQRMGNLSGDQVATRARFWSEVRPEWGLAGNAAFIVAPRSRTLGLNIGGRAFMHSYDYRRDADGKVLELIMTAPMIVASWINLQYYASSVDNRFFGSGDKVLHNVVGQFGVLEGNAGDLRPGLPWQSVHDGTRLQHEPLRLSVVIEAPRESILEVIRKHAGVRDLVDGSWILLTAIDNCQRFRYAAGGSWEAF